MAADAARMGVVSIWATGSLALATVMLDRRMGMSFSL
jgi:hypothetical protein